MRTGAAVSTLGRSARSILLGTVLLVATCGFVYELVIIALGTYLLGNSVFQVSVVLAAFVSSMGLGSLAAKPLLRRPAQSFVAVEAAVALIGGLSAMGLYAAFAYLDSYVPAMLVTAATIGLLVGCEIPLLLALLQRARPQAAGASVADLLAADYLGAVVGGVSFPFLLLPWLGQIEAALAIGALNAVAGLAVCLLARLRPVWLLAPGAVLAVLALATSMSGSFEVTARQSLFDDPIVLIERSRYQEIVLTQGEANDLRLFLNGDLQFSSRDEYRYHEALVHPAMAGRHARVLVLGGGDGLAIREVLRHGGVQRVVNVELDARMTALARDDERLRRLNRDALRDPRVEVVTADAFTWLRGSRERFDVVVADFPDPDDAATAKVYSQEFYDGLRRRALAPGGRLVVQAGSPYFARESFWGVEATLRAARWRTTPYHVDVPSFGDWGFVLASADRAPELTLAPPPGKPLSSLDPPTLAAAASFPPDRARIALK
ncbi:MAG: polyamine aminopropyltransferase, partial [Actinomycetota bacterium]|nr:polyamine aminopropyltransferase [Actinomycetota bacterium]